MKITTLTLSPAVDIEYCVTDMEIGKTSRAVSHVVSAGGKGINVSRCINNCINNSHFSLKNGKISLVTIAPTGGHTGKLLQDMLREEGILLTAVEIADNTRVNISVIPEAGESLEVNSPGTAVGAALCEIEKLILTDVEAGDVLVIAGSCPRDVDKSYPAELCGKFRKLGGKVVLDCDGEALRLAVMSETPPDLIKPNRDELSALVERELVTADDVTAAAESLGGGISVITTLSGDGSCFTEAGCSRFYPTEKRKVVRLKGAGDTFLGAFVYARYGVGVTVGEAMGFASAVAGAYVAGE